MAASSEGSYLQRVQLLSSALSTLPLLFSLLFPAFSAQIPNRESLAQDPSEQSQTPLGPVTELKGFPERGPLMKEINAHLMIREVEGIFHQLQGLRSRNQIALSQTLNR